MYQLEHLLKAANKNLTIDLCNYLRDRPFNLKRGGGYGFLFRSDIFFRTTQEFFLHQNQNIFFSNIGNQNVFLEKKT